MFRTTWAVLAGSAILLLTCTVMAGGETEKELKKFEGTWTVVGLETKGKALPEDALKQINLKVMFKGDKYTVEAMGEFAEEGTIKIDPTKKPAAIDLKITKGKDEGKSQQGIYELQGDTLKICMAPAGAEKRPTAFKSEEGSEIELFTLKRDKK